MNTGVGDARIGQWYSRRDTGEQFEVIEFDTQSRNIQIQHANGDIDVIDADRWIFLPLSLAEPPGNWICPVGTMETEDLGGDETFDASDEGMQVDDPALDYPDPRGLLN